MSTWACSMWAGTSQVWACLVVVLVASGAATANNNNNNNERYVYTTPPWTLDPGSCHLPSDPFNHPASVHRPTILNMGRIYDYMQPTFHLVYSGVTHLDAVCGLRGGVLYFVRRANATHFTFFSSKSDSYSSVYTSAGTSCPSSTVDCTSCPGIQLELERGSHGFVACSREEDAREAAWSWWRALPNPIIVPVLVTVAVLVVAISVGAAAIWWHKKRRAMPQKGRAVLDSDQSDC